ncbi:DUF3576 domain-containing protein [Terricaulis sp.]|uniref:DUF3576 domain-containing protein n=1 Tax=Terricaulis sp. TaxID=2768686 RepID=UPI003784BBC1
MTQPGRMLWKAAICLVAAVALSACSMFKPDEGRQPGQSRVSDGGSSGGGLFGGRRNAGAQDGIGVNSYLWRASLDTLNFMPLESADPFGGVIITDWYSDPTTPTERFKASVYILDTRLRADALNVSIFRQTQVNGQWTDASVDPDTEIQIENAILTRARQLRLSTLGN